MKTILVGITSALVAGTIAVSASLLTLHSMEYWTSVVEIRPGKIQAYVYFQLGPFGYRKNLDVKLVSLEEHYERTYSRGESKKKN